MTVVEWLWCHYELFIHDVLVIITLIQYGFMITKGGTYAQLSEA